ncbi:S-adenosyl-L-methionine-dependent methyltransferase [Cucurbitaria berberidis CBS 394.84]|uniref:S-adenosyl-L-methionine-dependent methyltransferase n=1 Tax=Cucurbitaria berberidis CBS 394.84 TaxID=1168544 RepID=A0A9P4GRJ8_9PLEO|nr:S-adenosyl-L-methionine-dependent methyltransferase [Cucurbitaria berberidis CBS 394.84]KAF1850081.1 S-adenosyl-L-methionine-dependent methyltransferase [Cucurbitaria berberidis CBS 394.84]
METNANENTPHVVPPGGDTVDPISDDADSAYSDVASETESVTSSILAGRYENGRRYHAYQDGLYMFPDDEQEQDRLDIKYASLQLVFNDTVAFAPLKDPHQILDIGTGTGLWAIDAAEQFPSATVTATDLSPIQPNWVPPNVKFEIDDAEQTWTWKEDFFDLIHLRTMTGCIRDWDKLFAQAYQHTKPGGFIELQEMDYMGVIQPTSRNPGTSFVTWCVEQGRAGKKAGVNLRTSIEFMTSSLEKAGFVDCKALEFKLPVGTWAKEKRLRDAGLLQLSAMLEGIEGLSLRLYTYYAGWSLDELKVLLAKVRTELRDPGCHTYWPVIVVYARKPEGAPSSS